MTDEVLTAVLWTSLTALAISSVCGYVVGVLTWPTIRACIRRATRALRSRDPRAARDRNTWGQY